LASVKRIYNIFRFGFGEAARRRKRALKSEKRRATFESDLWNREGELVQRNYGSYDEYVKHQGSKLERVIQRLRETEGEDLAEFRRRFAQCAQLEGARSVLCLGARIGTEVKALHGLGYFAVGIDLNPGEANALVLPGDFHQLVFADSSIDAVYTNTLDHVFDLNKMIGEVRRVLRPGGVFITDVLEGFEEGFLPGAYESTHWRAVEPFLDSVAETGGFVLEGVRDLGPARRDRWHQAVFRKPG
jgi:SAM-dependent methyltransferase